MLKSSAMNGKKLSIAPAYHSPINPIIIAAISLPDMFFILLLNQIYSSGDTAFITKPTALRDRFTSRRFSGVICRRFVSVC